MKKRLLIALTMALLAIMVFAGSAFADGGTANVEVSPINIDSVTTPDYPFWMLQYMQANGGYYVGTTVEVSGTVTITASVDAPRTSFGASEAGSSATATITLPDGSVITVKTQDLYDMGLGFNPDSNASQTFTWNATLILNQDGTYTVTQGGEAFAEWLYLRWFHIYYGDIGDDAAASLVINAQRLPEKPVPWAFAGFTVYVNNPYENYQTVYYTAPASRVLAQDINKTLGGVKVFIPAGTVVNKNSTLAGCLGMRYLNGKLTFDTPYMTFSNPVSVTLPNGVIINFTSIVNGVAQ